MSFNFTGLQNKERGKGTPDCVKGKNRNKLTLNSRKTVPGTSRRSQRCDVPDYGDLADSAATLWKGIANVSDGLKRGINLFRD